MLAPTIQIRVDALTDAFSPAVLHYMLGRKYAEAREIDRALQAYTTALTQDESLQGLPAAIQAILESPPTKSYPSSVLQILRDFFARSTKVASPPHRHTTFAFMTYWKDALPFAPDTIDVHADIVRRLGHAYWGVIQVRETRSLWKSLVDAYNQQEDKYLFIFGPNTYYRPARDSTRLRPFRSFHVARVRSLLCAAEPKPPAGLERTHIPKYYFDVCQDPDQDATIPYWFEIVDLAELELSNLEEVDWPHSALLNGFNGRSIDLTNLGLIPFPTLPTSSSIEAIVAKHKLFPGQPQRAVDTLKSDATIYDVIAIAVLDDTRESCARLARRVIEEREARQGDLANSRIIPENVRQASDLLDAIDNLMQHHRQGHESANVIPAIHFLVLLLRASRHLFSSLSASYVERGLHLGLELRHLEGGQDVPWPVDDLLKAFWTYTKRSIDEVIGVSSPGSERLRKLLDFLPTLDSMTSDAKGELLALRATFAIRAGEIGSPKVRQRMMKMAEETLGDLEAGDLLTEEERKLLRARRNAVGYPDSAVDEVAGQEGPVRTWTPLPEIGASGRARLLWMEPERHIVIMHRAAYEFAKGYSDELDLLCAQLGEGSLRSDIDAMRWRGSTNGLWRWRRRGGGGLRLYGWRESGVTEIAHAADPNTKEEDDQQIDSLATRKR